MTEFRNPKGTAYKTKKGSIGVVVDITTLKKVPTWGDKFTENHREFFIKQKEDGKYSLFEIWDSKPKEEDDLDVPF